jgi:hypothetical protein
VNVRNLRAMRDRSEQRFGEPVFIYFAFPSLLPRLRRKLNRMIGDFVLYVSASLACCISNLFEMSGLRSSNWPGISYRPGISKTDSNYRPVTCCAVIDSYV